jgi:hypothetical protein
MCGVWRRLTSQLCCRPDNRADPLNFVTDTPGLDLPPASRTEYKVMWETQRLAGGRGDASGALPASIAGSLDMLPTSRNAALRIAAMRGAAEPRARIAGTASILFCHGLATKATTDVPRQMPYGLLVFELRARQGCGSSLWGCSCRVLQSGRSSDKFLTHVLQTRLTVI